MIMIMNKTQCVLSGIDIYFEFQIYILKMSEQNEDVPDDCFSQGDNQPNRISIEDGVGLLISISKETSNYMNQLSSAFVQMNSGIQKMSENLASVINAKDASNNNGSQFIDGASSSKSSDSNHAKDSNQAKVISNTKDSNRAHSDIDNSGASKDKENGKPKRQ